MSDVATVSGPATCKWDRAWIGRCKEPVMKDGLCAEHAPLRCCSCGAQATHDCEHTGIQFVCGYPLCDGCTHGTPDPKNPGIFHMGGGHHPKDGVR